MTLAYWCVLIAAIMPYVFAGISKVGLSEFDNRNPRDFLDTLDGYRRRAHWAQLNSHEALPPFVAAVIIAHLAGAVQDTINLLAGLFILARVLYGYCYITDRSTARSMAWLLGLGCVIGLFVAAGLAG